MTNLGEGFSYSSSLFYGLLPWLTCKTSLTAKLQQQAGESSLVHLKSEWKKTDSWEKKTLNIPEGLCFQREIIISAQQQPCWYARSLFPENTYVANKDLLVRLEKESLAEIIFSSHQVQRLSLSYYMIHALFYEYQWLPSSLKLSTYYAVRRHNFLINNTYPFVLFEILLPHLMKVIR